MSTFRRRLPDSPRHRSRRSSPQRRTRPPRLVLDLNKRHLSRPRSARRRRRRPRQIHRHHYHHAQIRRNPRSNRRRRRPRNSPGPFPTLSSHKSRRLLGTNRRRRNTRSSTSHYRQYAIRLRSRSNSRRPRSSTSRTRPPRFTSNTRNFSNIFNRFKAYLKRKHLLMSAPVPADPTIRP